MKSKLKSKASELGVSVGVSMRFEKDNSYLKQYVGFQSRLQKQQGD